MCSIWGCMLLCAMLFGNSLGEISLLTFLLIFCGGVAFFVGGFFSYLCPKGLFGLDISLSGSIINGWVVICSAFFVLLFCAILINNGLLANTGNVLLSLRLNVNYEKKDVYTIIYGYMYYILYPLIYLSAYSYYNQLKNGDDNNKAHKVRFYFIFMVGIVYAIISTAKVKLFLLLIPLFFIRSQFVKMKFLVVLALLIITLLFFYTSMAVLNKLSEGDTFVDTLFNSLINYTVMNVFGLDKVLSNNLVLYDCQGDVACGLDNFAFIDAYKTNVFTIYQSVFSSVGFIGAIILQFFIGFFHNYLFSLSRNGSSFSVIMCSILYHPLIFQFFDNLYTSSFYLAYLVVVLAVFHIIGRTSVNSFFFRM